MATLGVRELRRVLGRGGSTSILWAEPSTRSLESMELVMSETTTATATGRCCWELLAKNYHTPFVHPEIAPAPGGLPMISDGTGCTRGTDRYDQQARVSTRSSHLLPANQAGKLQQHRWMPVRHRWLPHRVAEPDDECFPGRVSGRCGWAARRDNDTSRAATVRRPEIDDDVRKSIISAHGLVHGQDVDICTGCSDPTTPDSTPTAWCNGRRTRCLLRPPHLRAD